jgi:hypothetical protein
MTGWRGFALVLCQGIRVEYKGAMHEREGVRNLPK